MSLGRKDCLGAALGGCFWVVSGRRGGIENAFLNLHQSAEVLDVEDGTWSTVRCCSCYYSPSFSRPAFLFVPSLSSRHIHKRITES